MEKDIPQREEHSEHHAAAGGSGACLNMYIYICVCVCVRERGRERTRFFLTDVCPGQLVWCGEREVSM